MKITGGNPIDGINTYRKKLDSVKSKADVQDKTTEDSVEISSLSKELAALKGKMLSPEDIQEDKVQSLKKQIETGTYKLDSWKLANKITDEFLPEE